MIDMEKVVDATSGKSSKLVGKHFNPNQKYYFRLTYKTEGSPSIVSKLFFGATRKEAKLAGIKFLLGV